MSTHQHHRRALTREEFLGKPKITSNANAANLKPSAIRSLDGVATEPFMEGRYTAQYAPSGSAVFDGKKVIAAYDFGDTLVVDNGYRRQGIAQELVYQWRSRYPAPAVARVRTKASQVVQERVWDRLVRETHACVRLPTPQEKNLARLKSMLKQQIMPLDAPLRERVKG